MAPHRTDDLPRREDGTRDVGLIDDLPQEGRGTRHLMNWALGLVVAVVLFVVLLWSL